MKKAKQTSEFGKGFFYCLNLYSQHMMYLNHWLELYHEMRTKEPKLFREETAIGIWANGAKDHLYEMEVPPKYVGTEIDKLANEVRDIVFYLNNNTFMPTQDRNLSFKNLVKKANKNINRIFFLLDEEVGANPVKGDYE